ncbi:hypothetical protein AVANS_0284 [Campylobacter sp. RM5004]|nr:hypothetical protein [Campylobacter sp. RM5004]ULO00925.1 hypothetical protein AVANS_0284 [Campylobacter sp. RM5004]
MSKLLETIIVLGMVALAIITAWSVLTPNHLGIG